MSDRCSLRIALCVALWLGLAGATAAIAQEGERYRAVPANADGIGKTHMGRQISHVMGFQGAAWLEREEREREERSDLLLRILAPAPGIVVADVGAGTGYYARRIADLIGPTGKVYAIDVQPEMVAMLQSVAKQRGYGHITPVLGGVNDIRLPAASVDLAIMVDVYHELEFPYEVLASVVRAVKPGGRVVFVEYRAEDPRVPIKPLHKMSEAQVRREAEAHPLVWERTANDLPWQHVVIFKRK
jgi:ubiquinone/menaquinone biosynthesis C-methylase UbiE